MNKKGFTLAEIFIALLLIGTLTVILFPVIQKSSPDQNKIMFRKAFNSLSQAVSNLSFDDANYPATQMGTNENGTSVMRGFNYTTATTNIANGNTYNKFCYLFFEQLNTVSGGATSCPLYNDGTSSIDRSQTVTADGVTWYLALPYPDTAAVSTYSQYSAWPLTFTPKYNVVVIMDVNGPQKGPNCAADLGFDDTGKNGHPCRYTPFYHTSTVTPAYDDCISTDIANDPCQKNPDTFMATVRYDGYVQVGSGEIGGDACAEWILANPTNNAK